MTIAALVDRRGDVQPVTVPRGKAVGEIVTMLAQHKIGAVPVMDGDQVAGIMSERDVINCLAHDGAAILDWPVEKIMTAPAITVEPSRTVLSALSLMTSRRIRHLPVVEDGRLVTIVSIGDLVKFRLDQIEAEAEAMLSYIQTA